MLLQIWTFLSVETEHKWSITSNHVVSIAKGYRPDILQANSKWLP